MNAKFPLLVITSCYTWSLSVCLLKMPEVSIVLINLNQASINVCKAICEGYDIIREYPPRRGNGREELRRILLSDCSVLEDACYQNYLDELDNIRIPDQELWMPLLDNIRDTAGLFDDSPLLSVAIDNWLSCYTAYRAWLKDDPISQGALCAMWEDINGLADNDIDDPQY